MEEAWIAVYPVTLDFGEVTQAQTADLTLLVSNLGTRETILNLAAVSNNAAFTFTTPPATLAPGASAVVIVTFTAPAPGTVNGTLTFTSDNAINSPVTVPLTGVSVAAGTIAISINPS